MQRKELEKAIAMSLVLTAFSGGVGTAAAVYHDSAGTYNVGAQTVTDVKNNAFPGYMPGYLATADAAVSGNGAGVVMNVSGGAFGVNIGSSYNTGLDAHGIGAYNGAEINFAADTTLSVNNAATHTTFDNHGIVAGTDSVIRIDSSAVDITVSNGSHNSGLRVYKNGQIIVSNPLIMDITAGTAGGSGAAYGIAVDTHLGEAGDAGHVETGAVKMTINGGSSAGEYDAGIAVEQSGSYTANDTVDITVSNSANGGRVAGVQNRGDGAVVMQDVKIAASSSGSSEAFGIYNYAGGSYNLKNLDITASSTGGQVVGIANISSVSGKVSSFEAADITMELQGNGSEVYGIQNGLDSTNASDFKAGSINIKADNNGNIIGITNKVGSTFSAGDIVIDGTGKSFMFGIENQTANQMGLENVTVKLTKKDSGGGSTAGMHGISNPYIDFAAKNTTVILDNTKGTDKTTGINVGSYKADIDGDLGLDIKGNTGDVVGVNGTAEVTGDVNAILSGGGNVTGINGAAAVDGNVNMKLDGKNNTYGILAGSGAVTIGGDVNMDITTANGSVGGISTTGAIKVDGNLNVNIHDTYAPIRMAAVLGNVTVATHIDIGGLNNNINVDGRSQFMEGLYSGVKLADNSVTNISLKNSETAFYQTQGIYDRDDKGFNLGANAVLNVAVETSGQQSLGAGNSDGTFGLLLTNVRATESVSQAGSQINVNVKGSAVNASGIAGTVGISGSIKAAGDVNVVVQSEDGIGLRARAVDEIAEYTGDVIVTTNKGTAVGTVGNGNANWNASITIDPATGKKVQLTGDVKHFRDISGSSDLTKGSSIDISFKNAASFLTGASLGANNTDRTTSLSFDNGSLWNMTGDSVATKLVNNNDATIDMTQGADTLAVAEYQGDDGNFIMDTDLGSETDGDKITIGTKTTAGVTYIQVKDASLTNGLGEVTGVKNLLLVTDNSAEQAAQFVGKELNAGGLWDVTPTIENGLAALDANGNPVGTVNEWYLTKIAKKINNDTSVLLDAGDNSYALWRNSNDTLRKRLGDLRHRSNQTDGDGLWARYTGGKFGSGSFDSHYNMYQLGYDKADNAKSTYGFALERGTGRADYSLGSGKDKLFAGSLYGTWYGEHGNYTDVVAKAGLFDTDISSYGDYPDKANNKNHAYSLSIEYGKTIELSKERGVFIEPQAQFIMGRLSSSSYTTDRGNHVYMGGVNSYIGRLGFVLGQKTSENNDVYFKANLLHEFGGDRDIYMRAANGETLSDSRDYGDTWFELGLGTNVKLGNSSHFYGDIERSFGADIQKKWQINAGVRFEF
ncbi:autotransporter outer membrane beta-barrel domain-containing protein [uncultured Phascolarctobacterium sp.]|uniref:autotransporter outer membrane beta-barrel domain-containing protein n=1 Tax=uncultured Phascolarctobacterium sp. TaxID=512296 RepID=UPI00265C8F24|nr:autotransporter outer membrane beta-barrel domain-containing protein [uncultured Phascolarctobacterium sp.]